MNRHIFDLIIEKIKPGTILPKIMSKEIWRVKTYEGERRGEQALIYNIPNHKNPQKPHQKGINISEWDKAYKRLIKDSLFTFKWFKENMQECHNEGDCNYYTIGSVFKLLDIAECGPEGIIIKNKNIE